MNSLAACLRLARTEQIGPRSWRRLVAQHGSAQAALDALPGLAARGRRPVIIPPPDAIAREIEATFKLGGHILTLLDPAYPALLSQVPDAPPVLSVLGDIACLGQPAIALVGARNASAPGLRLAESLAAELAAAGLVVVSGLARGIDSAAHRGALFRQGLTIAAIAGGLDCPYPPENTGLQARIAEQGAVVTEAPLGTTPLGRHFPRRNRLIAGLTLGCVVVEAALHSGTLITARMAADYGREVFAVPGSPLDPRCRGSNDLLRKGAVLTEIAADIVQHLPPLDIRTGTAGASPTGTTTLSPPPSSVAPSSAIAVPPTAIAAASAPDTARPVRAGHTPGMPDLFVPADAEPAAGATPEHGKKAARAAQVPSATPVSGPISPSGRQSCVLDLLSITPIAVDDLVRRCQFSVSAVLIALTELELSGRVITYPDGRVGLAGTQADERA
ncbi:DNA-processing protein DprA [Acetobacter sp. TBRC 12305]|uniref:DNA-processing protein DprA n=1 Tax=Acetobacter garciniae TaxID=2817435 RepID=A0A939HLK3_9PROT|nr:DNA-processing protein DprA [Acetobacter garciniae]MBO1323763.1 DNA-processing protein DprA [Acetobacter garciniae]MBX0343452.1 DNA-processing protein DprA [Acetobacter garciniae]